MISVTRWRWESLENSLNVKLNNQKINHFSFFNGLSSSIMIGLIFLNAGARNDADDSDFTAHFGAIMAVLVFAMFGPAQSIIVAFPYERPIFMREYATGTCMYKQLFSVRFSEIK